MLNLLNFELFCESYLESNYAPLYHNTDYLSFIDIINDNELKCSSNPNLFDGEIVSMVSLTRKKDLDLSYYNPYLEIEIELDANKLRNKYKLIPYDYFIHNNREKLSKSNINREYPFEYEEMVLVDIDNVMNYIISINFKNNIIFNKSIQTIIPILKNKNIILYNDGEVY